MDEQHRSSITPPAIGIDLDGTIDEAPEFFHVLTHRWPGRVVIITYRRDRQRAVDRLAEFDIRYDEVVLVNSFEAKAVVIREKGILVYFDDQDEMMRDIPEHVNVFKFRNGGNFDYDEKLWLYSEQTGRQV